MGIPLSSAPAGSWPLFGSWTLHLETMPAIDNRFARGPIVAARRGTAVEANHHDLFCTLEHERGDFSWVITKTERTGAGHRLSHEALTWPFLPVLAHVRMGSFRGRVYQCDNFWAFLIKLYPGWTWRLQWRWADRGLWCPCTRVLVHRNHEVLRKRR